MSKNYLILLGMFLPFMACNNTPAKTVSASEVKLICDDLGFDPATEVPYSIVSMVVDGKKTPIDTINSCSPIEKVGYTEKQIPATAIAACGGWYAGAGDYFYVVEQDGKPTVFHGWQSEEQEDEGFHWEKIK